jgi:putative ABC transport system substrate-binding protein
MQRRHFITFLGGAAAWPLAARAQQPAMPVIGYLSTGSPDGFAGRLRAFRQGLSESGYVEGRNVVVEYRWAEGNDRFPAFAADLVRRQVDVIVGGGAPATLAAKAATTTIPIVFQTALDPVQSGIVASLNRPGGNLTGVSSLNLELMPKRLELLHELVPTAKIIALLINPTSSAIAGTLTNEVQEAARTFGLELHVLRASTDRDLDTVLTSLTRLRASGLVIGTDAFFNNRSEQLAALALRLAVPAIYQFREFAEAGGVMSYGGSNIEGQRLVGVYVGRILKGEKPGDLPVQQSTKIELIINMKTAKALGLTVPLTLLGRADEIIE